MKIGVIRKNRGLTAFESLLVIAVAVLIIAGIGISIVANNAHKSSARISSRMPLPGILEEILPPGNDANNIPVPVLIERHLGREWIIARNTTNWALVVYYQSPIIIRNIRQVTVDLMGNVIAPPAANNVGGTDHFQTYEVTASLPRGQVNLGPAANYQIDVATECFTIQPSVLHAETLFICVSDASFGFLKSLLQKPK